LTKASKPRIYSNGPYPDILFHFTSSIGLKGIIKEGFRPSYAKERIVSGSTEKEIFVPMISFCDLRLSELPFHMTKYGRFGIGVTKSWAEKMGLNPVAYVNDGSDFTTSILTGLEGYSKLIPNIGNWDKMILETRERYWKLLNIQRYIKSYEGKLIRKGKDLGNYRFADEREWRYVLPLETKGILPFMPKELFGDEKKIYNNQIASYVLKFSAVDVKYIIVEDERNIRPICDYIASLNAIFDPTETNHLLARILTASQIRADM
jgi:hypothetical protein